MPLGNLRTTTHYKGKEFNNEEWVQQQYHFNQQGQEQQSQEISETTVPAPVPQKKRRTKAKADPSIEAANTKDLKEKNIH